MSKLQLNENIDYKVFPEEGTGQYIDLMSQLRAEGRIPLSFSGSMKKRLGAKYASEPVRNSWLYNHFDLGDGNLLHSDGRAKIDLDSESLRKVTPETKLYRGVLPFQHEEYDSLQMPELTKKEVERYMNGEWQNKRQVLENKAWRILARHPDEVPEEYAEDKNLLEEYVNLVFSRGYDKAMAIYAASPLDIPTLWSWYVYRLDGYWSDAYGRGHLDDDFVRLVGVVPKAQSKEDK